MSSIRVLIADDHAIVRDGVRALLALSEDITVVGEAANGQQAIELARSADAGRHPDGHRDAGTWRASRPRSRSARTTRRRRSWS